MNLQVGTLSQATKVRYQVLAWACALSMITYIDRVCIKQVGGDIQRELGLTEQQFAWAFSAFGLAYALFEVPSGWLGDKFGPRLVLGRIVLWWSVFTALTGLIWKFSWDSGWVVYLPFSVPGLGWQIPLVFNSLLLLILIRFLFGMGEAGAYPNIARALRNWFPYGRRGLAQGLLWMFGRWGGAIAPLLIMGFSALFGWRGAFIAFGAMGMLWVIAFVYFFRDTPEQHPGVNEEEKLVIREGGRESHKPPPLSWKNMLKSPTLWCLSLMYFCSNAGWCFFITWDVTYYKKVLGLQGPAMNIASGAPLFFGGVACLLGGFLTDRQVRIWGKRWGRTLQGLVAYAMGGALFLVALVLNHPIWSVVCLCAASFMKDFAMAASWSTCIDIGHRYSGTVAGFMNMVGNLGTFVSPPIVAYLANTSFREAMPAQAVTTVGLLAAPAEANWLLASTATVSKTNWELALVYSACMFFLASLGWAFINPKRVIVYRPEDHEELRKEGLVN
jgi:ACS family glucarate transporter-like MFS transporter